MLLYSAAILLGLVVLIWSADLFIAGAASIARNLGMSSILIGMTIVALGTSAPEVIVSLIAALSAAGELAIGNAIGSNIANMGLVLGCTLLVAPFCVNQICIRREMPILLLITFGTGVLLLDLRLGLVDGLVMFLALAFVLWQMVQDRSRDHLLLEEAQQEDLQDLPPLRAWFSFMLGLLLLIGSSRSLVWGATNIAEALGVSQLVIGLTIIAIGTSLPELAATVTGALRGHSELALGNIIGSNLFNLLAVMPVPGMVALQVLDRHVLFRDYLSMSSLTLLLALVILIGGKLAAAPAGYSHLGRSAGILLLSGYALYYYWLYRTM